MRCAKLINGSIVYAPNPILHNGMIRYNPPGEVYLEHGYKPVTFIERPESPGVGWWIETWEETAEAIVQGWVWHEAGPDDEISGEEAIDILFGGDGG